MFQFPANPVLDQQFSPAGGPTYTWNGTGWAPFTTVYNGGLTFTGPVLFPDGTAALPSISWANDSNTGWYRADANGTANYSINGTPTFGIGATRVTVVPELWCSGAVQFQTHVYLNNATWIYGRNTSGNPAGVLTLWSDNNVYLGDTLTPRTHIRASGGSNITLGNGTIDFTGTVNGVVNITGQARSMYTPQGVNQTFNWVGNAGQPTWLWGGESGSNSLFNPSNFSVNYANYALASQGVYNGGGGPGNTRFIFHWHDPGDSPSYVWGSVDGTNMRVYPPGRLSVNYATSCGTASNSNAVSNVSGWNYSNRAKNPAYLWCTDGSGSDQFLTGPGNINVNYANSCDYSNRTGTVNGAGGGTVNGRILASYNSPGSTNDGGSSNLFAEGSAPALGFHYPGVQTWKMVVVDSVAIRTGSGSNNGPGGIAGAALQINSDGGCYSRNWYTTGLVVRDARSLERPLESLLRLRGVRCTDAETDSPAIGVDIDDIEREFPEMIRTASRPHDTVHGKAINYAALAAPIIEAIRELNERLTALENA
jgi:hypothetical protein